MNFDMGINFIAGQNIMTYPDWVVPVRPKPPNEVIETVVIIGGESNTTVYLTGSVDTPEN